MSTVRLTVRDIPADLHGGMRRLAKDHDRTLNGEIVRALREWVASQPIGNAKPARKGRK